MLTSPTPPDVARQRALFLLALLTALPLALRALFAAHVELSPDEAYYASWAWDLEASYFDHPPLVAWLIAGGTALFGDNELGVRAPGLLMGGALPWLLYGAARAALASRRASLWAAALASSTLLFCAGAVIVTPDTPLCLALALAVYFVARTAGTSGPRGRAAILGAGIALAAAFASKITTAVFFVPALVLRGLGPPHRRLPWLGLALVGLVPVLLWNADHGWPMLRFHVDRVAARVSFTPSYAGEFLAAQVALLCVGPAVLVTMAAWWALRSRAQLVRALAWWGVLPFAATVVLAMFTKVEANWIAPAFLPLFVVLAVWLDSRAPLRLRASTLTLVAGVAALLTVVAHVHVVAPFLPLPPARDPSSQLRGWRALAVAVAGERQGLPVLTSRYQEAAELAFYLRDRTVTTLPHGKRKSHFDFRPAPTRAAPRALCVHLEGEAPSWGRRVELPAAVYYLHRCTPQHWRVP